LFTSDKCYFSHKEKTPPEGGVFSAGITKS